MSQLSLDRLPFGQKFAFSSSHYTSSPHPRFALSVHILPVRHFAVRKLPNLKVKQYWRPEEEQLPLGHWGGGGEKCLLPIEGRVRRDIQRFCQRPPWRSGRMLAMMREVL